MTRSGSAEPPPGAADDPMVVLTVLHGDLEAQMSSELLRNNGIPNVVKAGGPGFSFGAPPPFGFESYIYVAASHRDRAKRLLDGLESPSAVEGRLSELGLSLPAVPAPVASYVPAVRTANLIFTAGQIPRSGESILHPGKVGDDVSVEDARQAAEVAALQAISVLREMAGDLDSITRIVKVTVFVNSAHGFSRQPEVANGASELLLTAFGERGRHARSAVGVSELPLNSSVEVELIAEVGPD